MTDPRSKPYPEYVVGAASRRLPLYAVLRVLPALAEASAALDAPDSPSRGEALRRLRGQAPADRRSCDGRSDGGQPRAAALPGLGMPHHRAIAVIDLDFFAGCGLDPRVRFARRLDAQLRDESTLARVEPPRSRDRRPGPARSRAPGGRAGRLPRSTPDTARTRSPAGCDPAPAAARRADRSRPPRPRSRWTPLWPLEPHLLASNRRVEVFALRRTRRAQGLLRRRQGDRVARSRLRTWP